MMRDYSNLITALRINEDLFNQRDAIGIATLYRDAADAIEELSERADELGEELTAAMELVHKRNDKIEKLKDAVPHWISVEERLPDYLDHVLCVNKFGIQMVGYLTDYKEGGFRCESGMDSCDYITHWMPLPQPPKEVE